MNIRGIPALFLLAIVLCGCGKPVPAEKADYVGEWRAPEMYLLITSDGSVRYERLKGGAQRSITGPLQGFQGDDFSVGLSFLSTTFVVSKPPYKEGDSWKMVVDGVELTKVQ